MSKVAVKYFSHFFPIRLKDEITMTLLISNVIKYLEEHDDRPSMLCRCYLRYIEHIYYKVTIYTFIIMVRLHTAINRADFVSWCMLYTYEDNQIHS